MVLKLVLCSTLANKQQIVNYDNFFHFFATCCEKIDLPVILTTHVLEVIAYSLVPPNKKSVDSVVPECDDNNPFASHSESDWYNYHAFVCKSVKIGRSVDRYSVDRNANICENFCVSGYLNIILAHFLSFTNGMCENIYFRM